MNGETQPLLLNSQAPYGNANQDGRSLHSQLYRRSFRLGSRSLKSATSYASCSTIPVSTSMAVIKRQHSSQTPPVTVKWTDLTVKIKTDKEDASLHEYDGRYSNSSSRRESTVQVGTTKRKCLLYKVSGTARPGRLVAVMGASGAGKSTFLTALSGRLQGSKQGQRSKDSSSDFSVTGDISFYTDINDVIHGDCSGYSSLAPSVTSSHQNVSSIPTDEMSTLRRLEKPPVVGFVYQDDLFVESLTVAEHLQFVIALRLRHLSEVERKKLAYSILKHVGLYSVRNVRIGSQGSANADTGSGAAAKGLSGGERKRLSFASAIVHGPAVLFCDEPTTGLDSTAAHTIVKTMRQMSSESTIICTIHQPSADIFNLFDDILILAEGGRTAYFGPRSEVVSFFAKCGLHCPPAYNVAEFIITQTAVEPFNEVASRRRIDLLCYAQRKGMKSQSECNGKKVNELTIRTSGGPAFHRIECQDGNELLTETLADESGNATPLFTENEIQYAESGPDVKSYQNITDANLVLDVNKSAMGSVDGGTRGKLSSDSFLPDEVATWLTSFKWVAWRTLTDSCRNKEVHLTRFVQKIIIAAISILLFSNISFNIPDQTTVQGYAGLLFVFLSETSFSVLYGSLRHFPSELPLAKREISDAVYSVSSYYVARQIGLYPGFLIDTILMTAVYYYGTQVYLINGFSGFMFMTVVGCLSMMCSAAFGIMFSLLFIRPENASTTVAIGTTALSATAGFYMALTSLPIWLQWLRYLNWFAFGYEALTVNTWLSVDQLDCQTVSGVVRMSETELATQTAPAQHCLNDGIQVINFLGMDAHALAYCLPMLVVLVLIFNAINLSLIRMRLRRFND